jgi:hypothetical protein
MNVEIIDGNGWRRAFPLEKNLIHIGADPRNDIVLETSRGTGVAHRHLQLIAIPGEVQRYRAINLGEADIPLGDTGERALAPRSMLELADGESLKLGEFTLVFRLAGIAAPIPAPVFQPSTAGAEVRLPAVDPAQEEDSDVIGLQLSLPGQVLSPEHSLEGIVTVHNLGNQPGAQFKLQVTGLDSDCYEIGPGPILFPNVEKGVFLRLDHPRKPSPPAGRHLIYVRATAPEAYPGQSTTVSQELMILPYHSHTLQIVPVD